MDMDKYFEFQFEDGEEMQCLGNQFTWCNTDLCSWYFNEWNFEWGMNIVYL